MKVACEPPPVLSAADVEDAVGCPNQACYVDCGDPCIDRRGDVLEQPHAARVKIAESIERDVRELGGLPEHDPKFKRVPKRARKVDPDV